MSSTPSPECNQNSKILKANKSKKKSKKKSKNRCAFGGCKKKLSVTDWACKCDKKFCNNHKPAINHGCSFDWKMQQTKFLKNSLEKGKSIDTKNFVGIC